MKLQLIFLMFLIFVFDISSVRSQDIPTSRLVKQIVLWIETSDINNAGTDADIYLSISWIRNGAGGGKVYDLPDLPGDDNERGETEIYAFAILDTIRLRDLASVVLINGMDGDDPGWHVKDVRMAVRDSAGAEWWIVALNPNVDEWLDTTELNGPAEPLPIRLREVLGDIIIPFSNSPVLRGR